MMGVWEHIDRLHALHTILRIEQRQVARLCSRIATHIDDAPGQGKQNGLDHIVVHTGAGRVGNNHIGAAMLGDKLLVAPVLYKGMRERSVILPSGCRWKYVPDGAEYEGGQTVRVGAPLEVLPYFERL